MRAARRFLPPSMSMSFPDFATESAVWRTRAHELWLDARADRDLRAQASAIQAALRGLEHWRNAIEEESRKKEASKEDGQHIASIESFDEIVRKVRNYREQDQAVCPTCRGFGDRERIRQFKDWLRAQGQQSENSFKEWSESTPKHFSGMLPGVKKDDENTDTAIAK